ncbi:MAG: bifunctional 2-polyprenyl-6-hydroxyphenol methylase/3-demethylubiquinol 3-O-methyltransferase UbiG [Cardiobacteriaceae bacterium]|nr:bifunctional 2-polyprenyl-6-hydroxyphenol methylase/3-demethylubiquinol 3-O-methyltransferase UbiG [Cardiobacteriaceae bacterium]
MLSETQSFNQYGAQFWDKNGPYRTLHHINPIREQFVERFVNLSRKKILDIGCGGGVLSEALAKKGAMVFGIDLSSAMLDAAKEHAKENNLNISYRLISSRRCVELEEKYDLIVCMEMLEHISDPASILRDCYQMLPSGGYLFLSTINRNLFSFLGAIVAAEYLCNIVPRGTHIYDDFIRPEELAAMAKNTGFEVAAIAGMGYLPFIGKAFFTRSPNINYLLALRKI